VSRKSPVDRLRSRPIWIYAACGAGVVFSLLLFVMLRGWEQREIEKSAGNLVHEQAEKLQVTVLRSMEVLYSVSSLYAIEGRIERGEFRKFVQASLARQPELQALSWNPVVPAAQRTEFESTARKNGGNDFQFREKNSVGELVAAGERPVFVPVFLIEPLAENTAALGYDLASDPMRLTSIEQARDSGKPVATAPIHLAQGPDDQAGFLVLLPIYNGSPPLTLQDRRARIAGFAVAVFRVHDLANRFFRELESKGVAASLRDESPDGEWLFSNSAAVKNFRDAIEFEIAGRRWAIAFNPPRGSIRSHTQSWLALMGGLALTILATAHFCGERRRSVEIAAANKSLQEEVAVRQRAEAEAARANQAKSDFLASMSHEIRTPLNAILGYTQLMQRDPTLPPEQHDSISGISSSGRHLLGLINEILDLSKIEAGRMELHAVDFDLTALANGLAATFHPLCARKKIVFRLDIGNGKNFVRGDEAKLRQILINLVGNAVKFTDAGEVCLRISPFNGHWHFEVFDTGLGIPENEQSEIFKPFHQGSSARHQGGTGLGLAIAQRQVELLGGKLQLQSERGVGSRFFFSVPFAPAVNPIFERAAPRLKLAAGQNVRALVVDDNRENRNVLGRMLSAIGCEVFFARDGAEAMVETHRQKPEIIFLDLLLPGMSGIEIARQILGGNFSSTPKIVAHTASALSRHREEARDAGCVDFIAKPFECENIYECLERNLGVEFQHDSAAGEVPIPTPLEPVALADGLCARLAVAAELHSTTALKACLRELRERGPAAARLADEIRLLMRSYDMDGIQRLLAGYVSRLETVRTEHGD
jgi:signal transduction histidine kinase/ActR/RegA family two-component response regulator